jgi:dihydroxy-acid dehydratase
MTLSETFQKPTTMLYRNFLAMEAEEVLRSHPADGAVLMAGCDKTTPALLMGAASMNLPAIVLPAGPMLRGDWAGATLGSGSDVWKYWAELRAGNLTEREWCEIEQGIARSPGHCMTMGTASTMTSAAEALGMTLPGAASIPAADSRHGAMAAETGRRIVDMVWEDLRPSELLTAGAFRNAVISVLALGGSTNATIHLIAMARRAGVPLTLDDFDVLARVTPLLANIRPSGQSLMEDFYYAGGLPAVVRTLGENGMLNRDAITVNGHTLWENCESASNWNSEVIRPIEKPLAAHGGIVVLRGNLAPTGAVLKPSAASPQLMRHRGRAVVFENIEHYKARINDPDLDVDASCVLVLKGCGPRGYPGMAEVGNMGLPPKVLKTGVTDMVRISDARMSGTAYGTAILHVSPEAAAGGPLALVQDGDMIELDVEARRLHLDVSDTVLTARREAWRKPASVLPPGGYAQLYIDHVQQADQGADLDFLVGCRGHAVPRESH